MVVDLGSHKKRTDCFAAELTVLQQLLFGHCL